MTKFTIADSTDVNGVCWLESPNDKACHTAGLSLCHCGNKPITFATGTHLHPCFHVQCSGAACEREAIGKDWAEAAKEWAQLSCTHSWMPKSSALGEHYWRCIHCEKRMEDLQLCPHCGSAETGRAHYAGSFALPECYYDQCEDCGHQWNNS